MPIDERTGILSAASTAYTTTYQAISLGQLPDVCHLGTLAFERSAESGSPLTVSVFLARDSAGDRPCSPIKVMALDPGGTTSTKGGTSFDLDVPYAVVAGDSLVYVVCKVGAATSATGIWRLTYTVR